MERLTGQVAVVTGGGSGMGEAAAAALAREGARVVVVGRRPEPLAEVVSYLTEEGRTALARPVDVTDSDAVDGLIAEVTERWGRVDVLVNSAGINVPRRDMASLSVADWHAVLQINLTGTFLGMSIELPVLSLRCSGSAGSRGAPACGARSLPRPPAGARARDRLP